MTYYYRNKVDPFILQQVAVNSISFISEWIKGKRYIFVH